MEIDIFEEAKKFDLADYVERLGVELRGNQNVECPFCHHKNFSIERKRNFFKCFTAHCDKKGTIIDFAKYFYDLPTNAEAAKRVLEDHGANANTEEQREAYRARAEEAKRKRAEERKQYLANQEKYKKRMQSQYQSLLLEAQKGENSEKIKEVFPRYSYTYSKIFANHIGFSKEHDSVVIINRQGDEVFNIKYRTKKNKDGSLREGKWHSTPFCRHNPFPIDFYSKESGKVVLCEGEKDVINLRTLGINALTMGGVTISWEEHKNILAGMDVYIFFDHDDAGYSGAIKRYFEIRSVAKNVYFILFFHLKGANCKKGYDVSDWIRDSGFTNETVLANIDKIASQEKFNRMTKYSTFKATKTTLNMICDWLGYSDKQRENLGIEADRDINNVFDVWDENAIKPKFDAVDIDPLFEKVKGEAKVRNEELKKALFSAEVSENLRNWVFDALDLKKTMLQQYSKMGRSDLWKAFVEMTKVSGLTILKDVGGLFVWDNRSFTRLTESDFRGYCMNRWFKTARVQERSHHNDTASWLYSDIMANADDIDKIKSKQKKRCFSLNNGTFTISEYGKCDFIPEHRKDLFCINTLDFDYNPQAECPKWQTMIQRVLPDEREREALQEFFGYCLYPKHDYETFLFLFGESGSNGKSVVLDVLSSFFGENNVSRLQMQNLKGHELHALKDKVLNIGSEVDATQAADGMQNLKALTSAKDLIEVNPKNKDNYILKKNLQPKMAFSGNKKPNGKLDDGVFRRMLMIRFDVKIEDSEKIYNISERFIDEMDGIFNWALAGLQRLIKNKKFTRSEKMIEDINEYKDEQNPMRVFVRDNIEQDENSKITKKRLYDAYCSWAKSRGHQPLSNTRFFSSFKQECMYSKIQVKETKPQNGERVIEGISLVIMVDDIHTEV